MNKNILKICSLLLVCASQLAHAQIAKMPFEFEGKHMYIKLTANNSDTLRFVFDTGATGASIDSTSAEKAGINKENRKKVEVAGSGGTQSYMMAFGQTFKLAGLEIKDVNPVLINFSDLTSATGVHLDGIMGYEILDKYVTQINFDTKQLSFYNRINEVDTTGYTGIPFEFSKGIMIPRFPISIQLSTGETFTGRVMFDSGAAFTLLISTPFNKFHHISEKLTNKVMSQGRGLNTISNEERGIIKSMNFNGFNFGNMAIALTVNNQAEPKDGYLGIIGIDIIKRFNVIVDYKNKKFYMKPNKAYNDPFNTVIETTKKVENKTLNSAPTAAESNAFLEKNKSAKGVKVTSTGLQYQIIKQGKGVKPVLTDGVSVQYKMYYVNGKLFSSTKPDTPWKHHIDKALPGMQEALTMMPVGSKWKLFIPATLAFGEEDYEDIPGGSALICEIELLKIVN